MEKEDFVVQPIVDVSPPKWHLGHTTWFFEQMILRVYAKDYRVYDPSFSFVFNSYYETVGHRVQRAGRGNLTRPTLEAVYQYRAYVDEQILSFLDRNLSLPYEAAQLLELGLQHEQQHQELLLYDVKYILGHNPLFPVYKPSPPKGQATTTNGMNFLPIAAGIYDIGHDPTQSFGFDNECGSHKVYLHDYAIADRLVTNGEYLAFVEEGGYETFSHWYMEAWEWVKQHQVKAPMYWHRMEGEWYHYTLHGLERLGLPEPLMHVSQFEAAAFAHWQGLRLPTEAEWEVACQRYEPEIHPQAHGMPTENLRAAPSAETGHYQWYGDCWEWTQSAYLPYPYYQAAKGAVGEYNGKFMINQMVLRGGSLATPKDHMRATYRNFFHPHLQWLFAGIRLAQHV